jgi:hypothetical protein
MIPDDHREDEQTITKEPRRREEMREAPTSDT